MLYLCVIITLITGNVGEHDNNMLLNLYAPKKCPFFKHVKLLL